MEVRNCPECGKVFTYIRKNLCPACQKKDEEDFKKVRIHLAKNPGIDIITLSEETEVDEKRIVRYIKEGRLSVGKSSPIQVHCEVCHTLISSGRFCKECSEKLTQGLKKSIAEENKKALEEMKETHGPRMHTVDHWKNR